MSRVKYIEVKCEKTKGSWMLTIFGSGQETLSAIGDAIRSTCKGKVDIRNIADPLAFSAPKKRKPRVGKVELPPADGASKAVI